MIPKLWYNLLKLTKNQVVDRLKNGRVQFNVNVHHMTLKSLLYKSINKTRSLKNKFKEMFGSLEPSTFEIHTSTFFKQCTSLKEFKRKVSRIFHPDANQGAVRYADECMSKLNNIIDDLDDLEVVSRRWKAKCARARRNAERAREQAKRSSTRTA